LPYDLPYVKGWRELRDRQGGDENTMYSRVRRGVPPRNLSAKRATAESNGLRLAPFGPTTARCGGRTERAAAHCWNTQRSLRFFTAMHLVATRHMAGMMGVGSYR